MHSLPNNSDNRSNYYQLVNLNQHPEFYVTAKSIAQQYFEHAIVPPCPLYSPDVLNEWLSNEYNQSLSNMRKGHYLDTGCIDEKNVGRFSDEAVKERLMQNAPNNNIDGAWLDAIMPCGSATVAEALLFQIRFEEAGAGSHEKNHPNLYQKLLKNLDIYLPSTYSQEFSEYSLFIDSAFDMPVLQLAVGKYPRFFLPQILGMTLWFEWNSTPASLAAAKCLRGRGIDDTYYKIHQCVDNPDRGHGFIARKAVEIYLDELQVNNQIVENHWKEIWKGYYTWDELNTNFEINLQQHLLTFDCKN